MRILLIEDDRATVDAFKYRSGEHSFKFHTYGTGEDGISAAKSFEYDVIVCELALPDMEGQRVVSQLRNAKVEAPIVVTSALCSSPEEQLKLYGLGVDDILLKPFNLKVAMAKLDVLVRRSRGITQQFVEIDDLIINLSQKVAEISGVRVHLTGKEFSMLEFLALRKGSAITKEMFLNHLYGGMDEPEIKIVDVFICKLRKKLADASGGKNYIETVWGRGYVLRNPTPQETEQPVQAVA